MIREDVCEVGSEGLELGARFWHADRSFIIIIIIFIYCNWVVNRWQWLFYMYTEYEIGYYW